MRLPRLLTCVITVVLLVPVAWSAADKRASADPPVTPKATDIVGVGNESVSGLLGAVADSYNAQSPSPARKMRVFDPTGPSPVKLKTGCATSGRDNRGISQLALNRRPANDTVDYCADFAGTAYSYNPYEPSVYYVAFGLDAVTWSKTSRTSAPSNAPDSLSKVELRAIYDCDASVLGTGLSGPVHWNQVGGTSTDLVKPVLPDLGSSVRAFFLSAAGVTNVGSCVNYSSSLSADQGLSPSSLFAGPDSKNVIVPYSVADYLAQSQNGHDTGAQGNQVLGSIEYNSKPYSPTTGSPGALTPNPPFTLTGFTHRAQVGVRGTLPDYLAPIFSSTGYLCTNPDAQALIVSYGFRFAQSICGAQYSGS